MCGGEEEVELRVCWEERVGGRMEEESSLLRLTTGAGKGNHPGTATIEEGLHTTQVNVCGLAYIGSGLAVYIDHCAVGSRLIVYTSTIFLIAAFR